MANQLWRFMRLALCGSRMTRYSLNYYIHVLYRERTEWGYKLHVRGEIGITTLERSINATASFVSILGS